MKTTPQMRAELRRSHVDGWRRRMSVQLPVETLEALLDDLDALDPAHETKGSTMQVLRHKLTIGQTTEVEFDATGALLHVDIKAGEDVVSLWATDFGEGTARVKRRFIVAGTGHEIDDGRHARHVGTALDPEREYVWHVFEVP